MVLYVIVVTFLVTLLMNKFTSIGHELIEIWMKPMPMIDTKFGIICIVTL